MASMNCSGQNQPRKTNQNIQVYLRCRPTNVREKLIKSHEVVEVSSNREVTIRQGFDSKMTKKFTFDRAFASDSKQNEVYSAVVAPLIEEVLAGYNCTVFAYGQTGTGKTYTMIGEEAPELGSSWEDDSMTGIIPRALSHLFDELRMMEVEFSMRISYLELYNEELCDLLSTDDTTKIRIFDDTNKKGSVIVQGLEEIPVHSKNDVYKLLAKGQERRKTAATLMNAASSRSHTVFSILVHIKESGLDGEEMLKTGKLNLVDLAGSENISKAGNEKGIRTRETVNINQSLLTLGRVITALVERTPHIPYRESKLTRLLQESLGGRTKTSIIATISPGHKDLEETTSTLEYAHRAKNIQNKPEINQRLTKRTVLKEYTEEIDRLKRDLMASRDKNGVYLAEENYNEMVYKLENSNKELNDKACLIRALKDDLTSKTSLFNEVSRNLAETAEELQRKEESLKSVTTELGHTQRSLKCTKRKVVEKDFLLDKHVRTEEVLLTQATELKKVAEHVKSDVNGLHESIDRRKETDVQTRQACENFVRQLDQNIGHLKAQVTQLMTSHLDQSKIIFDEIDSNVRDHEAAINVVVAKISAVEEAVSEATLKTADYVREFKLDEIKWTDEQVGALEHMLEVLTKRQAEHKQEILKLTAAFREEDVTRSEAFQAKQRAIVGQLKSLVEQTQSFGVEHAKGLNTLSIEIQAGIASGTGQLTEAFDWEARARNDEKRQVDELQAMLTQLSKRIEERETRAQERQKIVELFNGVSTLAVAGLSTRVEEAKVHQTAVVTGFESFEADLNGLMTTDSEALSKRCANFDQITQATTSSVQQATETVQTTCETLANFGASVKNKLDQLSAHISGSTQQTVTTLATERKSITGLLAEHSEKLKSGSLTTTAFVEEQQRLVREFENASKEKLFETADQMERFHQNEVVIYASSGETPVKKDYQLPNKFAMTSPHDRMLKRFRMERCWPDMDMSSVIAEDIEVTLTDDSIGDVPSDECLVNSTPLRPLENFDQDDKSALGLKDLQISEIHPRTKVIVIDDDEDDDKEN